jgi:hypothetical protein
MNLYAVIMRLSATQDRAIVIKAPSITEALRKVDTMRGDFITIAPLVSSEAYLEAIENGRKAS